MMTDAELAEAFRNGDDRAFAQLYDRYKGGLFVFAKKMLGERDAAMDLVQDVFLKAYERRGQLSRPDRFRGWLYAIGRNRCVSILRRERPITPLDEDHGDGHPALDPPDRPDTDLELTEDIRRIRQAIERIKPAYREVLILREYADLSYEEIAEVTESTESAVKSRLFKARKALHEILKPAFAAGR